VNFHFATRSTDFQDGDQGIIGITAAATIILSHWTNASAICRRLGQW